MVYDHRDPAENPLLLLADSGQLHPSNNLGQLKLELFHGSSRKEGRVHPDSIRLKSIRKDYFQHQSLLIEDDSGVVKRKSKELYKNLYLLLTNKQLKDTIAALKDEYRWQKKVVANQFINEIPNCESETQQIGKNSVLFVLPTHSTASLTLDIASARAKSNQFRILAAESETRERWFGIFQLERYKRLAILPALLLFFLTGSSIGTFLRKGGAGAPIVVATLFYVLFFMIQTNTINQAKGGRLPPFLGAWISVFFLLTVVGVLLPKANTGTDLPSWNTFHNTLKKMFSFVKKA